MSEGQSAAYLCTTVARSHHYHTTRQLYVGSSYLAVCCHCGRTQFIVWRGSNHTPDLVYGAFGMECGNHVRNG